MFFGVSFYSYTVGSVAGIIAIMDSKHAILASKLNTLSSYGDRINLPIETLERISRFLENENKESHSLVE